MLYYQSMIGWGSGGQGNSKLPSRAAADKQLKSIHEAASKQITAYGKLIYNETKVECNNVMSIERSYYGTEIRPLLDEYYEKTSLLAMMPRGSDYPDTPRPLC